MSDSKQISILKIDKGDIFDSKKQLDCEIDKLRYKCVAYRSVVMTKVFDLFSSSPLMTFWSISISCQFSSSLYTMLD